jgi:dephospho-CoA kinase
VLILGLTGSIGMGKSTLAKRLQALGIPVCDADAVVHDLYAGAAVGPVGQAFPGSVTDGRIDRVRLGTLLTQNPAGFKTLEAIVHPLVREKEREFLANCALRGDKIAVLDIPLLFETGGDKLVDATVVVSAPADVQRTRVLGRPSMTEQKFLEILARQLPDAVKRVRADYVVDTSGPIDASRSQLDKILAEVADRKALAYQAYWTD